MDITTLVLVLFGNIKWIKMARRSQYGRYIISAGEVGAYTVCPEAWRLGSVQKVRSIKDGNSKMGLELHKSWAKSYEDAVYFSRAGKALLLLLLTCILLYVLTVWRG